MNFEELIKHVSHSKNQSLRTISEQMGKSPNYIAAIIYQGTTPKADTLASILANCGYKLAAVPEEDLPESALVIDPVEQKS